jgi:hypothetical protein
VTEETVLGGHGYPVDSEYDQPGIRVLFFMGKGWGGLSARNFLYVFYTKPVYFHYICDK